MFEELEWFTGTLEQQLFATSLLAISLEGTGRRGTCREHESSAKLQHMACAIKLINPEAPRHDAARISPCARRVSLVTSHRCRRWEASGWPPARGLGAFKRGVS